MEKLEKIIGSISALIASGVLMFASPNYAEAKVTQVTRRPNGTIARIFNDTDPEGYLYPVKFCDKCEKIHSDPNRRKVELQFQTKSGRIVDYLPQTKRP